VEDVIDLNEKFLSMALGGIDVSELAGLTKIELRVDTSCHSLYVTGEILQSLEYLKLNDSVIRCFRDIGTSFKNVRVLHIARCEIKEVQGIQAFEQLEELYISFNEIDELFDISFLEHLTVLDFEGNNVQNID
jgi:Leucine-rich repeat (LRR) protein